MRLVRAITFFSPPPAELERILAENGWVLGDSKDVGVYSVVVPVPADGGVRINTSFGFVGPTEVGAACAKLRVRPGDQVAWSDAFDAEVPVPPRAIAADDKRIRKAKARAEQARRAAEGRRGR